MRKNVIALMLVLPLLFIFVLFTAVNVSSLGVSISANGIVIKNKPEDGAFYIDLAKPYDHSVEAEVQPVNASNKGYSFIVEKLGDSEFADISVGDDGKISAKSAGSAKIVAESKDGRFRDSVNVIVGSTKPYDFDFILRSGSENIAFDDFAAAVYSGSFSFGAKIYPADFHNFEITPTSASADYPAVINQNAGTLLLPFSGKASFDVSVPDGVNGKITKTYELNIAKPETSSGITVNGSVGGMLALEKGAKSTKFFVEADEEPQILPSDQFSAEVTSLGGDRYEVELEFIDGAKEEGLHCTVAAGGKTETVDMSFDDFDFALRSDLSIVEGAQGASATALIGSTVRFFAVPSVTSADITYEWSVEADALPEFSAKGEVLTLTATANTSPEAIISVEAKKNGVSTGKIKTLNLSFIKRLTSLSFGVKTDLGLAQSYALAGKTYDGENLVSNTLDLRLAASNVGEKITDFKNEVKISLSDDSLANCAFEDGKLVLTPKGTTSGELKVLAEWKGNEYFGENIRASVSFFVVPTAVEVKTSTQLFKAADEGERAIVLGDDIKLLSDRLGANPDTNRSIIQSAYKTMPSTYNTEFYKNTDAAADAKVKYCLEFKQNLYGNGHSIDAGFMTQVTDGSNVFAKEGFFDGPLSLVKMAEAAKVAAQDNIAFLVRTDGVTLHNATLLGCSDGDLLDEGTVENLAYLSKLNSVGTTLDINADVNILNCRVRNGRNVVRTYGGNRAGDNYFVKELSGEQISDADRINVNIEGCVLSQAREFILKIGANRALQTSGENYEPELTDADGNAYNVQTNDYLNDEYFYSRYVMTDVTLKDSVLETSGLFAVGVECNFAGGLLSESAILEGWGCVGGTSFASVLRLVGDVRIYDWKDLSYIDSSTLIEINMNEGAGLGDLINLLKLDMSAILNCAAKTDGEKYGEIIYQSGEKQLVHGGIALYGGGKNYSQVDESELASSPRLGSYGAYVVNISILEQSEDETLQQQGQMLPLAAGTSDFRFLLNHGEASYLQQQSDVADGLKYSAIQALSPV